MSRFVFVPIGSYGDVHPHIGIAAELRRRGHDVTVLVNEKFRPLVEREGLRFVPLGTEAQYEEAIKNPDAWHPVRGPKFVFRALVADWLRPIFEVIRREASGPDTVLVGAALALSARVARDALRVPTVTVQLQPITFRSVHDMPHFAGGELLQWLPRAWRPWIFRQVDRFIFDPILRESINGLLAEHGLPPEERFVHRWWNSPDGVLGLFPEWFAARQPDWPEPLCLAGFPLYDEAGAHQLPNDLAEFLADGEAPLVFTPGSANIQAEGFFREAAEACRRLGRRGLLLTRYPDQIPAALPEGVRHVAYAPFSELLPKAAALVHHGGIGTMAQAFRAGVPQLVMPLSHDQPDNANRLRRLGCGGFLAPKRFKARAVARKLGALLESAEVAAACRRVAAQFEGANPRGAAADFLESVAEQRLGEAAA